MSRRILSLLARAPVAGEVKTRLCPPLSPEQAAALYEAMLLDILDQHAGLETDLALWFTPQDSERWFEQHTPARYRLIAQAGEGLAARMCALFHRHADDGYQAIVLRGTDSPTLPVERVDEAFRALGTVDLVLCPDLDGGYNLIGLRRPCDALFRLEMSTATVLDETLRAAASARLRHALLPAHHDVDTSDDLSRLRAALAMAPAPRTRRTLAGIDAQAARRRSCP